jgi:hypothetical protein
MLKMFLLKFENSVKIYYFYAALCSTSTYQKSTGDYFCAFEIKEILTWFQADDACKIRGGRLPEVYNSSDNYDILKLRVYFILLVS